MKIKIKRFYSFIFEFFKQTLHFLTQLDFLKLLFAEEIKEYNEIIGWNNVSEMGVKSIIKRFLTNICNHNFLLFNFLMPKNRNWPTNLYMRECQRLFRKLYYHFCLHKVSRVAFFIDTSWIKPGSCHLKSASWDQKKIRFFPIKVRFKVFTVALNYCGSPWVQRNFVHRKIFQNVLIPNVASIWLLRLGLGL